VKPYESRSAFPPGPWVLCLQAHHQKPYDREGHGDGYVEKVREVVHNTQKKIYAAENIYAHRWQEGDVVIFHNRGVMHSITGQLAKYKEEEDKKRMLWQCTITSTTPPKPFLDYEGVNNTGYVRV
jgi:hypothetical protein